MTLAGFVLGAIATPAHAREPIRSLKEFRQERVVIQQWDLSCGAAALATILNHQHGDRVSERQVAVGLMQRPEYLADPDLVRRRLGFSLLDLKRFVDARGYEGKGFGRLQLADIEARAPIILPINTHGYSHFVVFRGRLGDRVLLADPAWQPHHDSVTVHARLARFSGTRPCRLRRRAARRTRPAQPARPEAR